MPTPTTNACTMCYILPTTTYHNRSTCYLPPAGSNTCSLKTNLFSPTVVYTTYIQKKLFSGDILNTWFYGLYTSFCFINKIKLPKLSIFYKNSAPKNGRQKMTSRPAFLIKNKMNYILLPHIN